MSLSVDQAERATKARTVGAEEWLNRLSAGHNFGTEDDHYNKIVITLEDLNITADGGQAFVPRATELVIYRAYRQAYPGDCLAMFQVGREQITLQKGRGFVRRPLTTI